MTPDRDPDHAVTAPGDRHRCPACGRSTMTHLSIGEAFALYGYSRTNCLACRLTDALRPTGPA